MDAARRMCGKGGVGVKKTIIVNPEKLWWSGDKRAEKYMSKVADAISRHIERGPAWTDIYNRAHEAVYMAITDECKKKNDKKRYVIDGWQPTGDCEIEKNPPRGWKGIGDIQHGRKPRK